MADQRDQSAAEVRLNRLLSLILESAVEVLGFDAATVTTRHYTDDPATVAATHQRMIELDHAQYATGEGPCLTALEQHDAVVLADAARWTIGSIISSAGQRNLACIPRCRCTYRSMVRGWLRP